MCAILGGFFISRVAAHLIDAAKNVVRSMCKICGHMNQTSIVIVLCSKPLDILPPREANCCSDGSSAKNGLRPGGGGACKKLSKAFPGACCTYPQADKQREQNCDT